MNRPECWVGSESQLQLVLNAFPQLRPVHTQGELPGSTDLMSTRQVQRLEMTERLRRDAEVGMLIFIRDVFSIHSILFFLLTTDVKMAPKE